MASFTKRLLCFFLLLAGIASGQSMSDARSLPGTTTEIPAHLQPWQERRAQYWKTLKGAKALDLAATRDFDAILTQFEKEPFSRTPMENMDILGSFYVPKDEVKTTLLLVSANAALGWYDALRFASASGRAEILNNEKFFARAYLIGGATTTEKLKKFLQENPDLARESVQKGIAIAERQRANPHYDVRWPSGYGLERVTCAQEGSCDPPKEMPADQWDKAWEDAKRRVISYYNPGDAPTSTSPANK